MDWRDMALVLAGVVAGGVTMVHGVLLQRMMVAPFQEIADTGMVAPVRRLVPPLLQFSTFNWLVSSLALIAVGLGIAPGWPSASSSEVRSCSARS